MALAAGAAAAKESALVRPRPDRVEVRWTDARLEAVGAGAADIRAPNADVARVGATRVALEAARARLAKAAADLPVAGGGTVGDRLKADADARARLDAAVARAVDASARYSSDGSVELTVALPLEAVRVALAPPSDPPAASDD